MSFTIEDIQQLISAEESDSLEFKETTGQLNRGMETGCAFLNSEGGGYLLFGVTDKGIIRGQEVTDSTRRDIATAIWKFEPAYTPHIQYVSLPSSSRQVIVIHFIDQLGRKPYLFDGKPYRRIESCTSVMPQPLYHDLLQRRIPRPDWSAQIVDNATIDDLDPLAIRKARELYAAKHKEKVQEAESWDDMTFLNKAKITVKGKITHAAIVLLGKEESGALLSPAVAQIRWILKDSQGNERDYEIRGCPFILNAEAIFKKIRNLKYRYINPEFRTLFPEEVDTYEPYVIREALNNAIAHQDYTLGGQINVVEYEDKLVFSNKGSFIPQSISNVLENDAPEEVYRNAFLARAMVDLRMVDTIGSGIRKMFNFQRQRLFPLPDYNLQNNHVQVTIIGKIINMEYANILANHKKLTLMEVEALNRVQLGHPVSDKEIAWLRKKRLIEGRKPNLLIAKHVAQQLNQKTDYSNNKGFEDSYYCDLILKALAEHHSLSKQEITKLLWKKLPDILNEDQKRSKIGNLLTKLRKQDKIVNRSRGIHSEWYLKE